MQIFPGRKSTENQTLDPSLPTNQYQSSINQPRLTLKFTIVNPPAITNHHSTTSCHRLPLSNQIQSAFAPFIHYSPQPFHPWYGGSSHLVSPLPTNPLFSNNQLPNGYSLAGYRNRFLTNNPPGTTGAGWHWSRWCPVRSCWWPQTSLSAGSSSCWARHGALWTFSVP